jgi:hypothetical protein
MVNGAQVDIGHCRIEDCRSLYDMHELVGLGRAQAFAVVTWELQIPGSGDYSRFRILSYFVLVSAQPLMECTNEKELGLRLCRVRDLSEWCPEFAELLADTLDGNSDY